MKPVNEMSVSEIREELKRLEDSNSKDWNRIAELVDALID